MDMGRKLGRGSAPFSGGGAGSPSNTKSSGPTPSAISSGILIHAAIWPQQIWAENWGLRPPPFWGRGHGSPSNTMWPGTRPICIPSFILIRPTVWPQCTNVTNRTDRQTDRTDNGPIAYGEPFYKRSPKNVNTFPCHTYYGGPLVPCELFLQRAALQAL